MSVKILVPEMGESVVDARVRRWVKKQGDAVTVGEPLVELETDKVDVEVSASARSTKVQPPIHPPSRPPAQPPSQLRLRHPRGGKRARRTYRSRRSRPTAHA